MWKRFCIRPCGSVTRSTAFGARLRCGSVSVILVALSPGWTRNAEGPGLAADLLARAKTVSIPMAGSFDSLNVATTAGIVLHHLVFS